MEQVAEAKCPEECHCRMCKPHCKPCQGTGLRWPSLSRECYNCQRALLHCPNCNGSGRIPDVTLEKVLPLLLDVGDLSISHNLDFQTHKGEKVELCITGSDIYRTKPTLLEAACAALLATL